MYAEQFSKHPQDVPKTVKIKWWERWLVWNKARYARHLWERWKAPGKKELMTGDDLETFSWALLKDKR